MRLCLLQKADGSFLLNKELAAAVGLSFNQIKEISDQFFVDRPSGEVLLATCLALVVLRWKFAKQRDIWEFQENKAMAWLASMNEERPEFVELEEHVRRLCRCH